MWLDCLPLEMMSSYHIVYDELLENQFLEACLISYKPHARMPTEIQLGNRAQGV